MSELKLKAKRKNTDDWLLFGITELFHSENGYFQVCVGDVGLFAIDPATIQPADDPRKDQYSNLYATVFWTEFHQKLKDDGIDVPEKIGENATKYLRSLFIRPDDPRKAMLDEIREKLGCVQMVEDKVNGWSGYSEDEVDAILNEMDTKL